MSVMIERLTQVVNSHSWTCVLEGGAITFHRDRPGVAISTHATEDEAKHAAEVLNVRAVLSAMREPTEAMVEAGASVDINGGEYRLGDNPAIECWQAMIDHMLIDGHTNY